MLVSHTVLFCCSNYAYGLVPIDVKENVSYGVTIADRDPNDDDDGYVFY